MATVISETDKPARVAPQSAEEKPIAFWRSTLALGLLGGLLFWAALPPIGLWPLGWLAATPWVLLARQDTLSGRRPYFTLWLTGCAFWLTTLYWLTLPHWATSFGWLALSLYLAVYWPAFVGLLRVAVHRLNVTPVVAAPVIWMGLELARGHFLTGFLMGSLAHTQYRQVELIQISDLGGAYLVSFMLVAVGAAVACTLPWDGKRGAVWPVAALVAVPLAVGSYGHWRLSHDEGRAGPRVALIQGSIDIEMKTDPTQAQKIFDEYFDLSKRAKDAEPNLDLVVWPETMFRFPWYTFSDDFRPPADANWTIDDAKRASHDAIGDAMRVLGAPALLGIDTIHYTLQREEHFNSALFVDPSGRALGRYDKCHRVVFGEYVPLAKIFPALYRLTPLPGGLEAGRGPACVRLGGVRYAPNICFETTVPHLIRSQVLELRERGEEPDVLVNLTNDGWFWGSSELDLHLACGVFRAVECRKPLLAAANTGFSAWIDADGRVRAQGARRKSEFLIAQPQLDSRSSWYLDHGDVPAGICLAACGILAIIGWKSRRQTSAA